MSRELSAVEVMREIVNIELDRFAAGRAPAKKFILSHAPGLRRAARTVIMTAATVPEPPRCMEGVTDITINLLQYDFMEPGEWLLQAVA